MRSTVQLISKAAVAFAAAASILMREGLAFGPTATAARARVTTPLHQQGETFSFFPRLQHGHGRTTSVVRTTVASTTTGRRGACHIDDSRFINDGLHRHISNRGRREDLVVNTRLFSSSSNDDDEDKDDSSSISKAKASSSTTSSSGSSDKLAKSYRLGQYVFGLTAAVIMLIPDRTLTTKLAKKWGGAAGYGLAAGLSHILSNVAASNHPDRMASETYKRLNVGLLGFSVLGLTAIPGEAGFFFTAPPALVLAPLLTLVHLFGAVLSYRGWKYGVVDLPSGDDNTTTTTTSFGSVVKQLTKELWQGTKSTFQGLRVQNAKKALTYRNCLLLVVVSIFSNLMDGIFHLRYQDVFKHSLFEVSLDWSAVSRLFMIATMIYSLKDAAERDRLSGTSFIQLNVMIGAWAALVGLGQSIYPLGIQGYRGVEMYAFSGPFFIKALKGIKFKKEIKQVKPSDDDSSS